MDEIAKYNTQRWDCLGEVEALLTRPDLTFTHETASRRFEIDGHLGTLDGRDVLCLASGGGHQTCAFAMLGAHVTLVDLSASQLKSDQRAADHYNVSIKTLQADMRDLSSLSESAFDVVYQPYSINFVPDCRKVFDQVARVLRSNGIYQLTFANPFTHGMRADTWDGTGYPLNRPYVQGEKLHARDEDFFYRGATGDRNRVPPPIEYRQTLGTVLTGLAERGFRIMRLEEDAWELTDDAPGTWCHYKMVAPPWFTVWCAKD